MVAGTSISTPPGAEYRGVFQDYVARSTDVLSGQLHNFEGLLSQELQARVWLTLSYGLRLNWAWSSTRDLLLTVAPKMEQAGMWEDWLPCLARGVEKSQSVGDREAEAELSLHLGHLLQRVGKAEPAQKWLTSAHDIFSELGQPSRQAIALGRMANLVYRTDGNHLEALDILSRALKLVAPNEPETAYCHFVRGTILLDQGELENATDAFLLARDLAERGADRRLKALTLLNLGRIYMERDLLEPAEMHYEWAIDVFTTIEDPVNSAVAQMNLGVVYTVAKDLPRAVRCFDQAETILRRCHGDRRYLAMVYNNKGMAYADLEDWRNAEDAYLSGIRIWRELDHSLARLNVEDNLGDLYLRQGHSEKAAAIFTAALQELQALGSNPAIRDSAQYGHLLEDLSSHLKQVNPEWVESEIPGTLVPV